MASIRKIIVGVGTLVARRVGGRAHWRWHWPAASKKMSIPAFSDTTHHDVVANALGAAQCLDKAVTKRVGRQPSCKGLACGTCWKRVDTKLAERLDRQMHLSVSLARAIPAPFDQQIRASNKAGRARIKALVDSLSAQARDLARGAQSLGLQQLHKG